MTLRVISLGAGVQSTTMALMAAHGEIGPMPDCAIFADTGWEPKGVYQYLDWLESVLPFPVHRVSKGNLRDDLIANKNSTGQRFAAVPWFIKTILPAGELVTVVVDEDLYGNEICETYVREKDEVVVGMGRRQCTSEYKLAPIKRKVRELLGGKTAAGACEMLIGISTDEAVRMKPSRVRYITNKYPLIDARMSRRDCLRWLSERHYRMPSKSACIGCPFHNDAAWRDLRDNRPDEWADAVEVDRAIRHQPRMRGEQYMHRQLVPLDQVDLSTPEDHGQIDMFNNECEGMCGV